MESQDENLSKSEGHDYNGASARRLSRAMEGAGMKHFWCLLCRAWCDESECPICFNATMLRPWGGR